jgi:2-hydroxycyclohexanecarboxyl-CoA dehydrogenase
MGRLDNQTALITGAARGLGRGIAARLVAEGAQVALCDLNADGVRTTAAELGHEGVEAIGLPVDVSNRDSVKACVDAAHERFDRIDILVNNAGWDVFGPFLKSDPHQWHRIIDINLGGVLNFCYQVAPEMVERGAGRIINIGSDAARVGSSGEAVYSAAKGGIVAFTKTLAREVARNGVTVNAVCPGPSDTALFQQAAEQAPKLRDALARAIPMRRLGEPDDIAAAVAFLAADETGYMTGQTLSVSGGLTMA